MEISKSSLLWSRYILLTYLLALEPCPILKSQSGSTPPGNIVPLQNKHLSMVVSHMIQVLVVHLSLSSVICRRLFKPRQTVFQLS